MVYKVELLVIAAILLIVGAVLAAVNVDIGHGELTLVAVLVVGGLALLILWIVLIGVANIRNR